MKLTIIGILWLHAFHANGNYLGQSSNSSSLPITSRRSTRAIGSTKRDFTRQFCARCNDESSGQCSKKTFLRIKRYSDALKCQPESTLVKLRLPGPEYSIEPAVVKVNRCAGYCRHDHGHTCNPTQTSFIKIPVLIVHHGMPSSPRCVEYEIEQHDSCACDCLVRQEDCSSQHRYENCSCKCNNAEEMMQCLENGGDNKLVWDEDKCECVCEQDACPHGFAWDSRECRCEIFSGGDLENTLF